MISPRKSQYRNVSPLDVIASHKEKELLSAAMENVKQLRTKPTNTTKQISEKRST